MNKELLERIRHEFTYLSGLYVSDLEDFREYWRLDYKELIELLEKKLN